MEVKAMNEEELGDAVESMMIEVIERCSALGMEAHEIAHALIGCGLNMLETGFCAEALAEQLAVPAAEIERLRGLH
jgi:hypothetical protein